MKHLAVLALLCLPICSAYPLNEVVKELDRHMEFAQQYLRNFYNLSTFQDEGKVFRGKFSSPFVKKIQEMQAFLGLEVTGKLDPNTLEVMHQPRCGVPDVGNFATFPGTPRWRKKRLTYRIVNYTWDLPRYAVDYAIEQALKVWEQVTPLTFSRLYRGEADMMISFAVREHGDFNPFDGPGQTLAHAYAPGPGLSGDVHFDDDERWTKDTSGTNLFLVAAHEVGHALGLAHSGNPKALMYPYYKPLKNLAHFRLSQDDVTGIQYLYGPHPFSSQFLQVPTQSGPPGTETPMMCDPALSFDAVTTLRGEILFFKDRYLWHKSPRMPQPEFHLISTFWPSLPSDLDAAYEDRIKDMVFIFKGNKFWAVRGSEVQAGYPRDIQALGFPPTISKIDAAISDGKKRKTYFFVKDIYWRFDEKSQYMDQGFPRLVVADFPGIKLKIDAALEKFGFFYFFSGSTQFEFNPTARRVTRVSRSNSWLQC
ncbi:stromelysin-2-like [Ctenodactylus gundi]